MKSIKTAKDFPNKEHLAIIVLNTRNVYHEGDQRSKDYSGHGYPAYTESIENFEYYGYENTEEGKAEWNNHLTKLYKEKPTRTDVIAFTAGPKMTVNLNVNIS